MESLKETPQFTSIFWASKSHKWLAKMLHLTWRSSSQVIFYRSSWVKEILVTVIWFLVSCSKATDSIIFESAYSLLHAAVTSKPLLSRHPKSLWTVEKLLLSSHKTLSWGAVRFQVTGCCPQQTTSFRLYTQCKERSRGIQNQIELFLEPTFFFKSCYLN